MTLTQKHWRVEVSIHFENKKPLENMLTEKFACPCCGYKTFKERPNGSYDICEVYFWEDDPIQHEDLNYEGGANRVSLIQAQRNFIEFGACEREMIKNVTMKQL